MFVGRKPGAVRLSPVELTLAPMGLGYHSTVPADKPGLTSSGVWYFLAEVPNRCLLRGCTAGVHRDGVPRRAQPVRGRAASLRRTRTTVYGSLQALADGSHTHLLSVVLLLVARQPHLRDTGLTGP